MSDVKHAPMTPQQPLNLMMDLHIAEYNALMTRNTYWITIQVSSIAIIVAYLTFMVPIIASSNTDKQGYLIWGSGVAIQCLCMVQYCALQEIYRNICYIEHRLRKLIQDIVPDRPFWLYEQYLAKDSSKAVSITDCAPTLLLLLIFVALIIVRRSFILEVILGLAANIPFFTILVLQTLSVIKLRQQFLSGEKNSSYLIC